MKPCKKCGALDRYSWGSCRPCAIARALAWNKAHPQRAREKRDKWIAQNPNENKACKAKYRAANHETVIKKQRAYYANNTAKARAASEAWRQANMGAFNSYSANRRAAKLMATPPWADRAAIKQFYIDANSRGLTVDHIVPLISKVVCGLHIVENFQMLTLSDNSRKWNKHDH